MKARAETRTPCAQCGCPRFVALFAPVLQLFACLACGRWRHEGTMNAIAVNPRRSALKNARIHSVAGTERNTRAACGLTPRNGWRQVPNRTVDCPRCLRHEAQR